MLIFFYRLAIVLLILSIVGYVVVVLKEKFFLKQNMIVIDNKHLNQEDLNATDVKEFIFKGVETRSGDEIKVTTRQNEKIIGTVIGMKLSEETIHIITYDNKLVEVNIIDIEKYKMLSEYGKFF